MKTDKQTPVLFRPKPNAGRVKFLIPYAMKTERELFKKINSSFYHPNQKLWSVVNNEEILLQVKEIFGKDLIIVDTDPEIKTPEIVISDKMQEALDQNHQKMILRNYSASTIRTYQQELKQFFSFFEQQDYKTVSKEQIEGFVYHLISKYKISEQKQNTVISAIKCYYEHTLGMPREYYEITRPKKSVNLPNVLSEEEVAAILEFPKNIKHRAILHTIYGAGLRVGEVIRLRVKDIRSDDGYIFIKDSKGKKDRHTVLSHHLLNLLREYYKVHKPSYWLFEGQDGGQYSARSIQNIYRTAARGAGVNPWSTPHTLRHSFATHLMKKGINIRYIQSALGHSSTKTTEVYTRVLGINNKTLTSPLDSLYESFIFRHNKKT